MKKNKYNHLVCRFVLAMAICFVWLLVETAISKANSVVYASEDIVIHTDDTDWEEEYKNLCNEIIETLVELDNIEKENIEKAVLETKNSIADRYEKLVPYGTLSLSLGEEYSDSYGAEITIRNCVSEKVMTYITELENELLNIEIPLGQYEILSIQVSSWNEDTLENTNLNIEPYKVDVAIN